MNSSRWKIIIRHSIHQWINDGFIQPNPSAVHCTNFSDDLFHHIDFEVCLFAFAVLFMEYNFTIIHCEVIFALDIFTNTARLLLVIPVKLRSLDMKNDRHFDFISISLTLIVGLSASKMIADFLLIMARTHPNAIWKVKQPRFRPE